jgi:hypothetical protein
MKKVLIISYFFSPCNLTASQRTYGWAKYLHRFGYKPIIITRHWDHEIKTPGDIFKASGQNLTHEDFGTHEVYRLPYRPSFRNRLFNRVGASRMAVLTKPLTLLNLVAETKTTLAIDYRNMYTFSRDLLLKDKEIKKVIISANPFNQFFFGYKLKRACGIRWIADYRDDWSTSDLPLKFPIFNKLITRLHGKAEKKWVSSASVLTSVSPYITHNLENFIEIPGKTILNGYELEDLDESIQPEADRFTITFNGSMYPTQEIEPFLEVIGDLIVEASAPLPIYLSFPGLAFDPSQAQRVTQLTEAYSSHVSITERIPREEVIQLQQRSDLLLMIAHTGLKGIPSSKLYEYIGLNKPVLLYPSDFDIIEETLKDVGLGQICNSKEEIRSSILHLIELKKQGKRVESKEDKRWEYSREYQTKAVADLLNTLS